MSDKKYILSEENLDKQERLHELVRHFTSNKKIEGQDESPRLGVFSKLIGGVNFYLYDDKNLLSKFPDGFVVEKLAAIPVDLFTKVENLSRDRFQVNTEIGLGAFVMSYMTPIVEKQLQITLNEEEKKSALSSLGKEMGIRIDQYINTPAVLEIKDILNVINGKGYILEDLLNKSVNENASLLSIIESNKEDAKSIPSIANLMKIHKESDISKDISLNDFNKMISNNFNPVQPLRVVLSMVDDFAKQSGKDVDKFMELGEKKLFDFLVNLPTLQFKVGITDIEKKVFSANKNNHKPDKITDWKKQFALSIANRGIDSDMREILVHGISGYDKFRDYDVKHVEEKQKNRLGMWKIKFNKIGSE